MSHTFTYEVNCTKIWWLIYCIYDYANVLVGTFFCQSILMKVAPNLVGVKDEGIVSTWIAMRTFRQNCASHIRTYLALQTRNSQLGESTIAPCLTNLQNITSKIDS